MTVTIRRKHNGKWVEGRGSSASESRGRLLGHESRPVRPDVLAPASGSVSGTDSVVGVGWVRGVGFLRAATGPQDPSWSIGLVSRIQDRFPRRRALHCIMTEAIRKNLRVNIRINAVFGDVRLVGSGVFWTSGFSAIRRYGSSLAN